MPESSLAREREVLAPLLELARGTSAADRRAWLDYLRVEGPTVVARLERLLAEEAPGGAGRSSAGDGTEPATEPVHHSPVGRLQLLPPPGRRAEPSPAKPRRPYVAPSLAVGGLAR